MTCNIRYGNGAQRLLVYQRRLRESGAMVMDSQDWQEYKANCGTFDFEVSLFVDSQVVLVALPNEDAIAAGCAPLFFHVNADNTKEVAMSSKLEALDSIKKEAFVLRSLPFSEMAAAFEQVETIEELVEVV